MSDSAAWSRPCSALSSDVVLPSFGMRVEVASRKGTKACIVCDHKVTRCLEQQYVVYVRTRTLTCG